MAHLVICIVPNLCGRAVVRVEYCIGMHTTNPRVYIFMVAITAGTVTVLVKLRNQHFVYHNIKVFKAKTQGL